MISDKDLEILLDRSDLLGEEKDFRTTGKQQVKSVNSCLIY